MSLPPPSGQRTYWCFISYRHADNKEPGRQWATWLHQAIETYEVPKDLVGKVNERGDVIPPLIFPVFRDEEELPADADLAAPIYRALDASKFLIVICSPRSAVSTYVNNEIRYFKQLGRADRVLAVMIEGEPNASWDAGKQAQGFQPEHECFPEALRHQVAEDGSLLPDRAEPIAADFRLGIHQGWVSPETYRLALSQAGFKARDIESRVDGYRKQSELMKLKVIAGILGVHLGTLTQRDKAHQLAAAQRKARTLRLWLTLVGILFILAVAGGCAGWWYEQYADKQRKLAEHNQEVADEQTKKTAAAQQQSDLNAKIAQEKAAQVEAEKKETEAQREKTVSTQSESDFLQGIKQIKQGRDSDALAYLAKACDLDHHNHAAVDCLYTLLFNQRSWTFQVISPLVHPDAVKSAVFSPDGSRILTSSADNMARLWDALTGKEIGAPINDSLEFSEANFSPDSVQFVTAYGENVQSWDAKAGQAIGAPIKVGGNVLVAKFSPDGARLVTASPDATPQPRSSPNEQPMIIQLWDAKTGHPAAPQMRHERPWPAPDYSISVNFSSDSTRLVSASADSARLWDATTGKPMGNPMRGMQLHFAIFSPDGNRIITTNSQPSDAISVWDGHSAAPVSGDSPGNHYVLAGAQNPQSQAAYFAALKNGTTPPIDLSTLPATVSAVSFNPQGTLLVTSGDKTIFIVDARDYSVVGQPLQHASEVHSATFSPDGTRVVTACDDNAVHLWDARTGQEIGEPLRHEGIVNSACFSPQGDSVLTGSDDKTAQVWQVQSAKSQSLTLHRQVNLWSAIFSPDNSQILTTGSDNNDPKDGYVAVWNVASGQQVGKKIGPASGVSLANFSTDGTRIATGSTDGTVQLWDASTGLPVGQPMACNQEPKSLDFSKDGTRLVVATQTDVQLWDTATSKLIGQPASETNLVGSARFSPDGHRIAVVGGLGSGFLELLDGSTSAPIGQPIPAIAVAQFSLDSTHIAAANDHGIQVFASSTGEAIGQLMATQGPVLSNGLSPDGAWAVVRTSANNAQVVNVPTGQPVGEPLLRTDIGLAIARSVCFSPDGTRVALLAGTSIQVFDTSSGQPICDPLTGAFDSMAFSSDGSRLATTSATDNIARIWDLFPPENQPAPDWLPELAEVVGGYTLSDSGSLDPVDRQKFFQLKAQLVSATGNDFWNKVGRWFFADPAKRTISPQSTVTIPEYTARQSP